jgi:hypothetical protein
LFNFFPSYSHPEIGNFRVWQAMGGAAGGDINADRGGGGGGSTRVRISESMFERAPLSRELRNGRGGCDGGLAVAVVGRRRRANLSHLRHRLYSSIVSYSAGARAAGRRSCAAVPCTVCGWWSLGVSVHTPQPCRARCAGGRHSIGPQSQSTCGEFQSFLSLRESHCAYRLCARIGVTIGGCSATDIYCWRWTFRYVGHLVCRRSVSVYL